MSSMESSYLPSDIIYESFSRATKEWNQTTHVYKFNKLDSQINNIVDGFLVPHLVTNEHDYSFASINDESRQISFDFLPGVVSLEAVSANHGIILCKSKNPRQHLVPRFFVCQPRINSYQQIPNPRTKLWTEKMGISVICSNPFRYKIFRISSSKENFVKNYQRLNGEVFDSETWTWKTLKYIMLPSYVMFRGCEPAVTVCGVFHWLLHSYFIFSFDVEEEEWKIHGVPVKKDDFDSIKLFEYQGKLAVICMDSEGYMQTWVLENYKNYEWKKKFGINMKDPDGDDRRYTYTPMAFYGSDIIVVSKKNVIHWRFGLWLVYFDFKNGRILKEEKLEKGIFTDGLLPFLWDSEPCCLRRTSESGVQRFEEEAQQSKNEGGGC